MLSNPSLDPILERKLSALHNVPERNPESATKGKAAFLTQAKSMAQTVSGRETLRHNSWIVKIQNIFERKEKIRMYAPLVTLFVVVSLLFGSAGATVFAAQASLPNTPLYSLKTFSEYVQFNMAEDPQAQFTLQMRFANRRFEEILDYLDQGTPIPEPVFNRWQQHMQLALGFAADLDDEQLPPALERLRTQLRTQARMMEQVHTGSQGEAVQARIRSMLQNCLQEVEGGLVDLNAFRQRFRHSFGEPGENDGNGESYGPGPQVTPGEGDGKQPPEDPEQTPGTGSSYGPGPNAGQSFGPGPGPQCTPAPPCSNCGTGSGSGPNTGSNGNDNGSGSGGSGGSDPSCGANCGSDQPGGQNGNGDSGGNNQNGGGGGSGHGG